MSESAKGYKKRSIRFICLDYKAEFIFGLVLIGAVVLSYGLAPFIPLDFFNRHLSVILNGATATVCLFGTYVVWMHNDGIGVRRLWAGTLLIWAVLLVLLLMRKLEYSVTFDDETVLSLHGQELVIGNFFAWLLLHYPIAVLRPKWLTLPKSLAMLLPVAVIGAADYFLPIDLRWLLTIYPLILALLLMWYHLRAYRRWCEENYSSMELTDIEWIWRYMIMFVVQGACYTYMSFSYTAAHAFTQQWLLLLMLAYSTEEILFRPDPWDLLRRAKAAKEERKALSVKTTSWSDEIEISGDDEENGTPQLTSAEYRAMLEEWMEREKPYLNPDFRLLDLCQVLPLNRTYLSQLINMEYGCNFYQFVTNYRIEEAKRLMREHPGMKVQDVAEQCGFSSPTVFGRVFVKETGVIPREWSDNS